MWKGWKVVFLAGILSLAGSAWSPNQVFGGQAPVQRAGYHPGGYGNHFHPGAYHHPYPGRHYYPHRWRPYPYRVGYRPYYRYRPYAYPAYYYPAPPVPYYPGW